MKIAFVTNVPTSLGRVRLEEEAISRGHTFSLISRRNTTIDKNTVINIADEFSDFDVVHFAGGLGNFVTQAVQLLLESRGVYCPNSYTRRSLDADDKVHQALTLTTAGVPMPKTIRASNPDILSLEKELGWPMVAKVPNSTQGKGVHLLRNPFDFETLKRKKEHIFQEFIDYEADYRVHVIGPKAFCPYRRTAPEGDFRANVSLGGSLEKIEDPLTISAISSLAVLAAEAMNLEFGGIDIIKDKKGDFYVLETNSDPGFKDVEDITGESFAVPIIDYYEQKSAAIKVV